MGSKRLFAIGVAALVALGVLQQRKSRRRHGADAPGRVPSVAESVLPEARDPEEVVEDLVPVMDERVAARR
ncbi:MAG: hypothetical protein XU10_C0032G0022 [Chloroflexi bacterium CSP1-4]|nr:MAG: hypothetical protein XU10_C0032G0022 [Chloroflexi bacterium CSP1-4]